MLRLRGTTNGTREVGDENYHNRILLRALVVRMMKKRGTRGGDN